MGKGKPRHNPDKPANKKGSHCPMYEIIDGLSRPICESGPDCILKCGGNPHNCIKVKYQTDAITRK
jgi:hypothetical protein